MISSSLQAVKSGLINLYKLFDEDTKLQVKWCQLAVLSLNATQVNTLGSKVCDFV